MLSPLEGRNDNKQITEKDIPMIKDRCLARYGMGIDYLLRGSIIDQPTAV